MGKRRPTLLSLDHSSGTPLHVNDPRIQRLARQLRRHRPHRLPRTPADRAAAVALVVRPEPKDLEILLIRRAEHPYDPWSGHMALPGGRRDAGDVDEIATAMRETGEEVGISLDRDRWLATLDDVSPRSEHLRVVVSSHVFVAPPGTPAVPNHEAELALWIPMRELADPGARTEYLHSLEEGQSLRFPALALRTHVVWGLTYRILSQFLQLAVPSGTGGPL